MKFVYPILTLVLLTGCGKHLTPPALSVNVPVPPALTQSLASPCPKLSLLADNTIATLVLADSEAAVEYAKCKHKASELVRVYNEVRQELIDLKAKQEALLDE
jgi:hypothetical protein